MDFFVKQALEKSLWKRGIRDATLRSILCGQILITGFTLTGGLLLWWLHEGIGQWFFWFGVGAALSAWNFYALIKHVQSIIVHGWSKSTLVSLLIHTNIRLLFTGVLLYTAIVWCKALISALLPGLAVLLAGIVVVSLEKRLKKPA